MTEKTLGLGLTLIALAVAGSLSACAFVPASSQATWTLTAPVTSDSTDS